MGDSRCSSFVDEPLPGTAATETGWLCIENHGAWPHNAMDSEAFTRDVARDIEAFARERGLRVLLIRRPGRAGQFRSTRAVFIVQSRPEQADIRRFDVADYAEIPMLREADVPAHPPIALICAHGKRDVCCAVGGRPIAAALAGCYADEVVWECSHTGGHRFAPVMIVLPTGYTYGRVTGESAKMIFDAARANAVIPNDLRGRSTSQPAGQVAETTVRQLLVDPIGPDELALSTDGDVVTVTHRDGRRWQVRVSSESLPPRPPSCGKPAKPAVTWRVSHLTGPGVASELSSESLN